MKTSVKNLPLSPDIAEMRALSAPRWVLAGAWRREVVQAAVNVSRHAAAHDPGAKLARKVFGLIAAGLASSVRSPERDRGGAARALVSLAGRIGRGGLAVARPSGREQPCR